MGYELHTNKDHFQGLHHHHHHEQYCKRVFLYGAAHVLSLSFADVMGPVTQRYNSSQHTPAKRHWNQGLQTAKYSLIAHCLCVWPSTALDVILQAIYFVCLGEGSFLVLFIIILSLIYSRISNKVSLISLVFLLHISDRVYVYIIFQLISIFWLRFYSEKRGLHVSHVPIAEHDTSKTNVKGLIHTHTHKCRV